MDLPQPLLPKIPVILFFSILIEILSNILILSYEKDKFLHSISSKFLSMPFSISATTGSSSKREITLSPLANVCAKLLDKLLRAITGP